jgi:hypothetical protein
MSTSYVTLDGQPYAIREERPIVGPLTMWLHRFWKEYSTISQWIYGAWEC